MEFEPYEPTEEEAIGAYCQAATEEFNQAPDAINQPSIAQVLEIGTGKYRILPPTELDERGRFNPDWATCINISDNLWDVTFPSGNTHRVASVDGEGFVTQS